MKPKARRSGFTIVEILIVIVVIAVLAGITSVAFAGVQSSAKTSNIVTRVNAYEKVLKMYKAEYGYYPTDYNWVCIGKSTDFTAANGFASGQCTNGAANNYHSTALEADIRPYISSIDNSPNIITNDTYGGRARGLIFDTYGTPANGASLNYFLDGNVTCPLGQKRPDFINHATSSFCYIVLP